MAVFIRVLCYVSSPVGYHSHSWLQPSCGKVLWESIMQQQNIVCGEYIASNQFFYLPAAIPMVCCSWGHCLSWNTICTLFFGFWHVTPVWYLIAWGKFSKTYFEYLCLWRASAHLGRSSANMGTLHVCPNFVHNTTKTLSQRKVSLRLHLSILNDSHMVFGIEANVCP